MERLLDALAFEQTLHRASRVRTAHFAVHHLPPADVADAPSPGLAGEELSTMASGFGERAVDDFPGHDSPRRLGAVVPKRHARRAVTRSLLKRQIYAAGNRHGEALPAGVWVVRLRAPFDRFVYPSASSTALRSAARLELDALFRAAAGVTAQ